MGLTSLRVVVFPCELNPGFIVLFDVLLESGLSFDVFPVGRMFSNQGSTLLAGEFEGNPCAGLHRTSIFV
jgi:hypothetical protein